MLIRCLFIAVLTLLSGCQAGYYWHLAQGHWQLARSAQPVDAVLQDPNQDNRLHEQLLLTQSVLTFAEQQMGLPANGSYQRYVAIDRDWVVWNLVSAPEFSLTANQWCYPVVGCASYRGHYDLERAERTRMQLETDGMDVYGSGAIAYSTLGWFKDPLTSLMLEGSEGWIVELLIHELVHQKLYKKGDTQFNESLATAVAREGRRQWMVKQHSAQALAEQQQRWQSHEVARQQVNDWLAQARSDLQALYDSELKIDDKRTEKARIQHQLRQRYMNQLSLNPALSPWREWFDGPLNNAQLALRDDYLGQLDRFNGIILRCGGDWSCFWQQVSDMSH